MRSKVASKFEAEMQIRELQLKVAKLKGCSRRLQEDLHAANASAVLQHLHLYRLRNERALAAKSGRKVMNLFTDGKGDVLTDPGFAGRVQAEEERREAEEKEHELKADAEAAWVRYRDNFKKAQEKQDLDRSRYTTRNMPAYLKKKPKRQLKKHIVAEWMQTRRDVVLDVIETAPISTGGRNRRTRRNLVGNYDDQDEDEDDDEYLE
jgi:hypothetical protein